MGIGAFWVVGSRCSREVFSCRSESESESSDDEIRLWGPSCAGFVSPGSIVSFSSRAGGPRCRWCSPLVVWVRGYVEESVR